MDTTYVMLSERAHPPHAKPQHTGRKVVRVREITLWARVFAPRFRIRSGAGGGAPMAATATQRGGANDLLDARTQPGCQSRADYVCLSVFSNPPRVAIQMTLLCSAAQLCIYVSGPPKNRPTKRDLSGASAARPAGKKERKKKNVAKPVTS